ncbi:MAG: antibiotic biosynthesis monooxygenase [Pleurocapsa minor GSE-CHR-MK-17-07R]|jgi:heme-degrading monooxygenase HmoA|nr:antibiotic biosynthesis monooxygenase [Pleurocapsa minor GSE-CHR-MK 17-07R]
MYAQVTTLHVPLGSMQQLRTLIQRDYLPHIAQRDGFVSAQLLEQLDDADTALLTVFWRDQSCVEAFHNTGSLAASIQGLASVMPGVRVTREAYMATLHVEKTRKTPMAVGG